MNQFDNSPKPLSIPAMSSYTPVKTPSDTQLTSITPQLISISTKRRQLPERKTLDRAIDPPPLQSSTTNLGFITTLSTGKTFNEMIGRDEASRSKPLTSNTLSTGKTFNEIVKRDADHPHGAYPRRSAPNPRTRSGVKGADTPVKPLPREHVALQKKITALETELQATKTEIAKMGLEVAGTGGKTEEELKEKIEEAKDLRIKFEALGGEKAYEEYVRRKYGLDVDSLFVSQ